MNSILLAILLFLVPLTGYANSIIDPVDFEQLWLQNNQRNLYKRYQYYNEQVQRSNDSLYLLGVDAAPDKRIKTSDGVKDALISRLYIHYQSQEFVFLLDWFSAIPQPQTTEGFTYGDLVIGKTWRYQDRDSYLTLGLRQKSTPRSVIVNSETVFNAVSDATEEEYSVYFHFNYHGYDLGTYYSENNKLESAAIHIPVAGSGDHSLSSTVYYYSANPDLGISKHFELSLDHAVNDAAYKLRSGAIVGIYPDLNKVDIVNLFASYMAPVFSGVRFIGGLYYYFDVENEESLPGAKLGIAWSLQSPDNIRIGLSAQQNAVGDYNALIIRDEPILSFTLSAGFDVL